jgi:hypothetical protein
MGFLKIQAGNEMEGAAMIRKSAMEDIEEE